MRVKIEQIHDLLMTLPLSSSVSITRPDELAKELFTHRGSGTLVRRGEQIVLRRLLEAARPASACAALIESGFGRKLAPDYFETHQAVPRLRQRALPRGADPHARGRHAAPRQVRGQRRCAGRRPGPRRLAGDARRQRRSCSGVRAPAIRSTSSTSTNPTAASRARSGTCSGTAWRRSTQIRYAVEHCRARPATLKGPEHDGADPTTAGSSPSTLQRRHVRLEPLAAGACRRPACGDAATASCGSLWYTIGAGARGRAGLRRQRAGAARCRGTAMPFAVLRCRRDSRRQHALLRRRCRRCRAWRSAAPGTPARAAHRAQHRGQAAAARRMRSKRWAAPRWSFAPAGSTMPRATRSRGWARSRTASCATTCAWPTAPVATRVVFSIIASEWPTVKRHLQFKLGRGGRHGHDEYASALVGARGHVGAELIRLIAAHPRFELAFVSSRERAGQRVADHDPDAARRPALSSKPTPDSVRAAGRRRGGAGAAERQGRALRRRGRCARAGHGGASTCPPTTASTTAGTTACRS